MRSVASERSGRSRLSVATGLTNLTAAGIFHRQHERAASTNNHLRFSNEYGRMTA